MQKIYWIYIKNNQSNSVFLEEENLSKNENINESTYYIVFYCIIKTNNIFTFYKKNSKIYNKWLISHNLKIKSIYNIIVLILVNISSLIILF